ncbi:serine hydrolase domain-containing protein [Luteimonas aquatica]|uniref:serine hydrolase domain-containing protein n=1 Tax=Luteimonas aquatica TaxID=450364 RepID=UPI001F59AC41|nr:serine hydrolase domain-containing protein [Luteimonas aquatica]
MNLLRGLCLALLLTGLPTGNAFGATDGASAAPKQRMQAAMQANRERYGIAGQAVMVVHNGQVLFRGADGQADVEAGKRLTPGHVFPVYSLSKLFVSTLVMQLVDRGSVDPDAAASAYLPDLPGAWRNITVRQFLDHTSGVAEYFEGESPATFPPDLSAALSAAGAKPPQFAPGTQSRYTQTNYLVLSALLQAHYGKPYVEIAEERIIRRLHLRHTWLGPARLPGRGVAAAYLGKDGRLQRQQEIPWPDYSYAHGSLYASLDDLARFLRALGKGELVGKATLQRLWRAQTLRDGRRGTFAGGWEYGESAPYRFVGHDGGARVRVRLVFEDALDGDLYAFLYLTNGSARNVWSRTLVDSAMAAVAPRRFPSQALSERLIGLAWQGADAAAMDAAVAAARKQAAMADAALEGTINNAGYAARESLGAEAAIRLFRLNTRLFPGSANTWDSLAETYQANGEQERARALYEKARSLTAKP